MSVWRPRAARPVNMDERAIVGTTLPLMGGMIGGRSYQDIDPTQGETSLQSVAFRSGADMIASIVSELPLGVFRGVKSEREDVRVPGYLEDPAGDGYGRQDWIYQMMMSWFLRGNMYAQKIDVGPTGMIRQADIFHPDKVHVFDGGDGHWHWSVDGQDIPQSRIYHKRINPVPGTLLGLSVVSAHADLLGLSIAASRFGRGWFNDGGHPGGILSNELADLTDDKVIKKAKDRFMAALFGVREPVVLGKGWKYQQIQVSPEESQFLGTSGWSEAQCARMLGPGVAEILGYESGGSMTYANVIDRDVTLLKYTIGKWVNRVERVLFDWLPRPQYAVLDRDAFMATSPMQRWQVNNLKLSSGAYVINEIREDENDKPVDWGNKPFMPVKPAAAGAPPAKDNPNDPPKA